MDSYLKIIIILATEKIASTNSECWNLLWLYPKMWEEDYIPNQLLRHVCINQEVEVHSFENYSSSPLQFKPYIKEYSILVIRQYANDKYWHYVHNNAQFLESFKENGIVKFAAILVGEESNPDDRKCTGHKFYDRLYRASPLIIRNYFARDCLLRTNVLQVPLGATSPHHHTFLNILKETKSVQNRAYKWSFASTQITPIRVQFIQHMHRLIQSHPNIEYFLKFRKQAPYVNMTNLLLESVFGVCPEGGMYETWRFYETLERGAIPIINATTLQYYYNLFLPCNISQHLVATENPESILPVLLSNLDTLSYKREKLISAYNAWRDDYRKLVAQRINDIANISMTGELSKELNTEGKGYSSPTNHNRYGEENGLLRITGLALPWDYTSCHESVLSGESNQKIDARNQSPNLISVHGRRHKGRRNKLRNRVLLY